MKKKFLLCVFAATFCLSGGVFVASCDDVDNPVDNPSTDGETAYVVAATVGEASYLVAVSSLDEGTGSTKGKGTEVIGGTYWVFSKSFPFSPCERNQENQDGRLHTYTKPYLQYVLRMP